MTRLEMGPEVGWRPDIKEIPGFLQNVRAMAETLPEEAQTAFASLEKEWNRYNDLQKPGTATRIEVLDEAREKVINQSLELSDKLPKVRINLQEGI